MSQKGFSLVELLVVVAIIGVLAGVGVVGYDRYVENTKRKVLEQNYEKIVRFMETEFTIVANNLGSAVDEYDRDNMANDTIRYYIALYDIKLHCHIRPRRALYHAELNYLFFF